MLLLSMAATLLSYNLSGQGTPVTLNCSQLDIVVCQRASTLPPTNCVGCTTSPVDCHRMQYEVRLRAAPTASTANSFDLAYTDLEITTILAFTGTGSGMTRINEKETNNVCTAPNVFINVATNTAGVKYLSGAGSLPTVRFTRTQPNTHFYATLFTIVVDIFPGDVVELDCDFFRYANGDLMTCFYPNLNNPPQPNYIEPGAFQLILGADTNVAFDFNLANMGTNSATVPLAITSNHSFPLIMPYVDLKFTVQASAPIPPPVAQNVSGYAVDIKPSTGLNSQYIVTVRRTGAALNFPVGGSIVLFDLLVQRPNPQNAQSMITLDYMAGRFEGQIISPPSSFCRTMAKGVNGERTITFTGDPICVNSGLSLNVTGIPGSTSNNCGDLYVSVDLGIPSNSQVRELRFVLDFDMTAGAFIDDANIQNQLPCSLSSNQQACTDRVGTQQCYSVTGNKLTYCFKTATHVVHNGGSLLIPVSAESGCINAVTVSEVAMYLIGQGTVTCVPDVNVSGFYLCSREIAGKIKYGSQDGCWVEAVGVEIIPTNNACPDYTEQTGCPTIGSTAPYSYCVCDEGSYSITPVKDDNPSNGLTTYDLVLISKHILGIESLNSPYKMVAADANRSGSITTFDIVEFRKLVLGIYTKLPNNTSWRFLPRELTFVDPLNPFPSFVNVISESITAEIDNTGIEYSFIVPNSIVPPIPPSVPITATTADFVGIKVGDVNCTAVVCGTCDACGGIQQRPTISDKPYGLGVQAMAARAGDALVVPVYAAGEEALIAFQAGIKFDPARFEYMGIAAGDVLGLTPDCFNLSKTAQGEIKVLWLSGDFEENYLQPDQALFYVALRALVDVSSELPLRTDNSIFEGVGYTASGLQMPVQIALRPSGSQREQALGSTISVTCAPSPTSGAVEMNLFSESPTKARVSVFGPFGVRMYYWELELAKGVNNLPVREVAAWPAGIYTWQVQAGAEKAVGRFVKQ